MKAWFKGGIIGIAIGLVFGLVFSNIFTGAGEPHFHLIGYWSNALLFAFIGLAFGSLIGLLVRRKLNK